MWLPGITRKQEGQLLEVEENLRAILLDLRDRKAVRISDVWQTWKTQRDVRQELKAERPNR
jgi:hypothetical protein